MSSTADHDSCGLRAGPRNSKAILASYMLRYSLPFLLALLFLSLESVCDLLQPTIMSRVLDEGVATGNTTLVIALGLRMIGVAGIGAIGAIGRNIVASVVAYKFAARLRADLFSTMIRLQAVTADGFDAASLVTRQTNDVSQVQTFVNGMMRIFAKAPIVCIGSLVMAYRLEPSLAPIALVAVIVVSVLVVLNMKLGFPLYVTVQKSLDALNAAARSFLGGVRVVKAFDRFDDEAGRFSATSQSLADSSRRAAKVAAIFGPASAITVNLGLVAILWLGGLRVRLGDVPVGRVVAFISYMTQILFALTVISHVFSWFVRASASWKRIRELFDRAAAAPDENSGMSTGLEPAIIAPVWLSAKASALPAKASALSFEAVTFSYPSASGIPALRAVSFSLPQAQVCAVIGSTGAGKSTLTQLISRNYACEGDGKISVYGRDVRTFALPDLRAMLAFAPQKSSLFTASIYDNIAWGSPDADRGLVEEAARIAQADEFIRGFPQGYGSLLGRGGINVSGGQRQRVSLARAIVRVLARRRAGGESLLVLDDCTSAVDVITEAKIRGAVQALGEGVACLWITQRAATAMRSHSVLVLDDGGVAGFGTHAALLRDCSIYRDICVSQLGREVLHGRRE